MEAGVLALARWQFALTTIYHFLFVPLTLGLVWIVAILETIYVRTGNETYKRMTKFWGKLFVINFAMGVVTGIVQEFQFGMNWSEYSRFVGDIFGAPLAIEALLAFFIESTFLGVWLFGWDKLSKGVHAAAIWLVAIASNLSALWILIANSFMQQPVGYTLNPETGRAEMSNFFELILNPNIWYQFPHVITVGLATGGFFVLGISAYHLARKNEVDIFRRSFQLGAVFALVASLLIAFNGHSQAQHMVESQPMKMAAAEALWETEDPASFSLLTIGDLSQRSEVFSIRVPNLLSLLSYNQLTGEVHGIYDLQAQYEETYGEGNYIPPVAVIYWSFRIMVGIGTVMIVLAMIAMFLSMAETFDLGPRLSKIYTWGIGLPFLAASAGWVLTEVGRFPWVVFGLMRLEDGVSVVVSAFELWVSLIGYMLIYTLLAAATFYLLRKYAVAGPAATDSPPGEPVESTSMLGVS